MTTRTPEKPSYLNWPRDNKVKNSAANKSWLEGRSKMLSGFCSDYPESGLELHEGTKPKNFRGRPMKTCPHWQTCPCSCHKRIDEMFEATGMERREMPNPDYEPDHNDFVIPIVIDDPISTAALTVVGAIGSDDVEIPTATAPRPPTAPLAHRRTDTGRAARGGLEAQVWDACSQPNSEVGITPKLVADWIAEKYKIPTPSTGAINAVWVRWSKLGFAETAKKPNRFIGFKGQGTWEELATIKSSNRRAVKNASSKVRRGFR